MARQSKSNSSNEVNPLGWMVTFSDLITLLLTFFVLLISMSSMDVKTLQQSFGMFSGGSGPLSFPESSRIADLVHFLEQIEELPPVAISEEDLKSELFDFRNVEFQQLMDLVDRDISVFKDERGLVIQLADYILFYESGSVLRPEYLPILSRVASILRSTQYLISVEGHTDSSPLEGGAQAWAWELSLDRAIAVLEFFTREEGLRPSRFRVGGFGSSMPVAPNDTPQNRAKNRRIEIILHKDNWG
jgi:chemotaxis protein MotB